jgi:hypothetical protein
LGFTYICGPTTKRATHNEPSDDRQTQAAKLKEIRAELRKRLHAHVPGTVWLRQMVRVLSNITRYPATRREYERFHERLAGLLPCVEILQPYPDVRFDAKYPHIRGKNRVR